MACDSSFGGCRLSLYTIRPPVASCGNCVLPQLAAFMYGNIHEEKAIGKGEFGNRREELQMRTQHGLTRRGFIASTALLMGGLALTPSPAFGLGNTADGYLELEGSAAARDKWARAVSRAEQEGGMIVEGADAQVLSGDPVPIAGARTVSVSKNQTIGLIYDTVIISANYAVTSANKISPFNWTTINCSASSISSSHYDRAVLDNGRTNAIHYHAEIKAAGGWPTYVGDFYAEFYYTFTGTMS